MNNFIPLLLIWGYSGAAALVFSVVSYFIRRPQNLWIDWLKNFLGAVFIFSGAVKAIDPMGTALKMKDYFDVLGLGFFADYALPMAIFMIVLEIHLGINFLLGILRRWTLMLTIPMLVFFTFLTGYTYLSGYSSATTWGNTPLSTALIGLLSVGLVCVVLRMFTQMGSVKTVEGETSTPRGTNTATRILNSILTFVVLSSLINVFMHSGSFVETDMKVTDCGCFGDFLKLKPYVSYIKDLILLPLALVLYNKQDEITPLLKGSIIGVALTGIATIAAVFVNVQNYAWDEPIVDFRPFRNSVNILETKKAEIEAEANLPTFVVYVNKKDGSVKEIDVKNTDEMMKVAMDTLNWKFKEQKRIGEPVPARSKISEFSITGPEGSDISEILLTYPEFHFVVIVSDWKHADKKYFTEINKLIAEAKAKNVRTYALLNIASPEEVKTFAAENKIECDVFTADEKLLKTMIRSNPGVFLMKNGTIIHKWHRLKLPSFSNIQSEFKVEVAPPPAVAPQGTGEEAEAK
jgi:hypothetical protein